jgi:Flp pilus assembly pilin Flp
MNEALRTTWVVGVDLRVDGRNSPTEPPFQQEDGSFDSGAQICRDVQFAGTSRNEGTTMQQKTSQRGQGMTEYIIVVALVAIAAIGVYTAFGKTVRGQMAVTAQALAGNAADQARTESNTGGQNATTQAQRAVQLDNFDQAR